MHKVALNAWGSVQYINDHTSYVPHLGTTYICSSVWTYMALTDDTKKGSRHAIEVSPSCGSATLPQLSIFLPSNFLVERSNYHVDAIALFEMIMELAL